MYDLHTTKRFENAHRVFVDINRNEKKSDDSVIACSPKKRQNLSLQLTVNSQLTFVGGK